MHFTPVITDSILYIGANDTDIDLFESKYPVKNGVSYNSYVILDEKVAVMDTIDARATDTWLTNLLEALSGRDIDYLVISHLEPDHAANIEKLALLYPDMKLVGNAKTFAMLPQFFSLDTKDRQVIVTDGEILSLGKHTLQFFIAPMVHWPEVMVTYEQTEKILFSADAFGKFGSLDHEEDWLEEARRYFINIVGKYGVQVQALLKRVADLDIHMICPLHGPVLTENLGYYIEKYDTWSSYRPEESGVVVAYASIHGNTASAARKMVKLLWEQGEKNVVLYDLARSDVSYVIADAFRFDRMILAGATYEGGLLPCMENLLLQLKSKNYQNRFVGLIENGSWGPVAGKRMKEYLGGMKNVTVAENIVTVKSVMKEENVEQMRELAKILVVA
ncbi:MAG: FprA family A-type flavoprotein [Lachnospiraceae bacterium]|nr:FprA family A-type flavoprotein [Lachnospiraceae bacterium]